MSNLEWNNSFNAPTLVPLWYCWFKHLAIWQPVIWDTTPYKLSKYGLSKDMPESPAPAYIYPDISQFAHI